MTVIFILVGFFLLIKGADIFVDGSSSLARILKIPSVVIGLTIVAMGTSAPEASVSINASLMGKNDIAISNILGSNIFNSLIVVGICAILSSFYIDEDIMKRDLPFNVLCSIILSVMLLDKQLSQIEGIILLVIMGIYLMSMILSALKQRHDDNVVTMPLYKSFLYIILGLLAVIIGGDLVVDYACIIADELGLSQNFIGLTIVAIGTSLPELVTSIVATRKNESGLALGNAVGSNIFNIMFILGMSSLLSPIRVSIESLLDGFILIGVSILLYVFSKTDYEMTKKEGFIFVFIYFCYMIYLLL